MFLVILRILKCVFGAKPMPAAGEGGGELAELPAAQDPLSRPGSPSPHTLRERASPNLLVFLPRRWSRGGQRWAARTPGFPGKWREDSDL